MTITDEKIFQDITQITCMMLAYGGDNFTTVKRAVKICENHGYKEAQFFVNMGNFQGIAYGPDGKLCHSLVELSASEMDYTKLSKCINLFGEFSNNEISPEKFSKEIAKIEKEDHNLKVIPFLCMPLVGGGFTVMFNGGVRDTIVAIIASLIVAFFGELIKKVNPNLLLYNAVVTTVVQAFVLLCGKFGFCENVTAVTAAVVMLLISALGIVNGMWALLLKNTANGVSKLTDSLLGALGIALGIRAPLIVMKMPHLNEIDIADNFFVSLVSCVIACLGLGLIFFVGRKSVIFIVIGSAICWSTYCVFHHVINSEFFCVFIATLFTGVFSLISGLKIKKPPISILTVSLFPLIPGVELLLFMYGLVMNRSDFALKYLGALATVCAAIIFAFSFIQLVINILVKKRSDVMFFKSDKDD